MEFSKPDKLRPIPEGTVKVFFDITVDGDKDEYDVEFNFENESLKHRMDSTMREDMFQVSAPIQIFSYLLTEIYHFDRAGSTESSKISTRSSNSCTWVQSSNTLVMLTRRASLLTHLFPSLTS